jgi:carboxymethylenebutenolidase
MNEDQIVLTPEQQAMVDLWEAHLAAEFEDYSLDATMATMVDEPYVNHVPTLIGGTGRRKLAHFYGNYFIGKMPPDAELEMLSRTVGQNRIVDEFIFRCTHTTRIDYMLPGVPPTGRRLEIVTVVIVHFEDGKIHHERIHWDQASALVQAGLLDPQGLPVAGAEAAQKMRDPNSVPSNALLKRVVDDPEL